MKNTNQMIHVESLKLFANLGYEATSMSKIADKVGITKASIYSHFKSKEEILFSVLEKEAQSYYQMFQSHLSDQNERPLKDVMYRLLKQHILPEQIMSKASIDFYYRFKSYQPIEIKNEIIKSIKKYDKQTFELMEQLIQRGKDEGIIHPDLKNVTITRHFFCLVDGIQIESNLLQDNEVEDYLEGIFHIYWLGIQSKNEV